MLGPLSGEAGLSNVYGYNLLKGPVEVERESVQRSLYEHISYRRLEIRH